MGHILKQLAKCEVGGKSIFDSRFVIEVCERIHFHYRSLRLILSLPDFLEISKGLVQARNRWLVLGQPEPKEGQHIELCRKKVATDVHNDGIQVNLNDNLYNRNKDKIYAEGAEFTDEKYVHLKIRDMRIELSLKDFKELANAIIEAERALKNSGLGSLL